MMLQLACSIPLCTAHRCFIHASWEQGAVWTVLSHLSSKSHVVRHCWSDVKVSLPDAGSVPRISCTAASRKNLRAAQAGACAYLRRK